jgi:AcrR family transcriptional regulator
MPASSTDLRATIGTMSNKTADGPRWTRLGPEARREQILATARRLLEAGGYDAVSMSDVADAAEVTRGLVHHYFGSKRELYLDVVRSVLSEAPALATPSDVGSREEMVARNTHALLDYLDANRGLLMAMAPSADPGRDPEVAALADLAREAAVDQVLRNHLGDTADAPPEARLVVRAFFGLVEAASREWLFNGRATREQVEALVAQAILGLMRDALPAVVAASDGRSA